MSEIVAMSPSSRRVEELIESNLYSFGEIIGDLVRGKKVARVEWDNKDYWLKVVQERLKIHKPEGAYHDLIVTLGDMMGEDWYVMD